MALEHLRHPGKGTLRQAIAALPPEARTYLRPAVEALSELSPSRWEAVVSNSVSTFGMTSGLTETLASAAGFTSSSERLATSGGNFITAILTAHPEASADDLVSSLIGEEFASAETAARLVGFAELIVSSRASLSDQFEANSLANAILPSLERLDTTVDLRLEFDEKGVVRATPVMIAMLDTDAQNKILWFQASGPQLRAMIAQLSRTLEQVEKAERWAQTKTGP